MKYQAPVGVTAIFCAGEEILPDETGAFEVCEHFASELAAHGLIPPDESNLAATRSFGDVRPRARARAEKAS